MDPRQGSSSRRGSSSTVAGRDNMYREVMPEHPSFDAAGALPSYCLFPPEETMARGNGSFQLHELFSTDRHQQPMLEVDPKAITAVQSGLPIQARSQLPAFYHGGIHFSSPLAMGAQHTGFNAQCQTSPAENLVLLPAPVSGGQVSGVPGNAEQDLEEDAPLSPGAIKVYEHLISVQVAYFRICLDPTVATSERLLEQAMQDLKNHCACDALVARYYENNSAEADTTVIRQQSTHSAVSSQVQQHHRARGSNNVIPPVHQQETVAPPAVSPTLRLMDIRGKVAASCADRKGSRFVQQAIKVATPEEIVMVYREIMPCVRTLAVDMFGNHAIQKILEHGPRSCKREVISNLIGHMLPLSLDKYSCRVIQKAFDIGEHDQKVAMARELSSKVLKCVRDQFANHVIQKCIECLPPKDIDFILQNFERKAKALSIHPYGCHVIQKLLCRYRDHEIYHTLTAEITENVNKLSADRFGNYVVQQLVEHGDHAMRSTMVKAFAGRVVSMCYHKFASNVVEKCLTFGSQEDRKLIADEIIGTSGGQHFDHLVDMMINPYANFVIQKMVVTAEEEQVALLLDLASSNAKNLARYPNGRHVIDYMEKFLSATEGVYTNPAARCRAMQVPVCLASSSVVYTELVGLA